MWIKEGDTVEMISGEEANTEVNGKRVRSRGKVLSVDKVAGKVLVEGINRVFRHVRRSQRNPQGGRLEKEMPVAISNVKVVCSVCGKPSKMGARFSADGAKERWCKTCKATNATIAPAKARYAKK